MPGALRRPRNALQTAGPIEGALEALSEAIESGAGLPAVARAAAAALGASVALIDRSSAVLAVAGVVVGRGEQAARGRARESTTVELRVADAVVGELRYRSRGAEPSPALARMVSTLLALELERARSPEWASDEAAGAFVRRGPGAQGDRPRRHRRPRRRARRRARARAPGCCSRAPRRAPRRRASGGRGC